ncbi:MAG: ATP-binding cassette domain-containing protein [Actinobacteria bacterium]|nr:ATP-binding cassette domain-containing protein [Actinomycetota bacterium]
MTTEVSRLGSEIAAGSSKDLLRAEGVTKTFPARDLRALDPIDLRIRSGEFVTMIGPSGCGKSTLLKIMAGLLPATDGRVVLDGRPVVGPRTDVGIMFQQATLLPWRTALENVMLPIEIRHGARAAKSMRQDAVEVLNSVGLDEFEKVYPHELSGGMAQRVAICRMLVTQPSVLLLDEPFGALDELTRDHMNEELQRICEARNATAFMVTHSIPEAVFLADRVVVMSARPGCISDEIEVKLARPRTLDMTTREEFGKIVRKVRSKLDLGGQR